jgi:16S rRNA (adenine1518-N6/adenine1519-N6)-dimethyltransferase
VTLPSERRRPSFASLAPQLEARGFRPSKRFGQNFLVDDAMCREVAHASGVGPGDLALEVGVGLGFLTHHLLLRGARVVGVEIDPRLAEVTRGWMGEVPELELLVTDVLAGKHELEPRVTERLPASGPWHLVSNLPYAVASPVVALLLRLPNPPRSLTVLVQHEVAERFCAEPGHPAHGGLSVRIACTHTGAILRSVPSNLFRPRPKVDSSIARLVARPEGERAPPDDLPFLDHLVATVFTQRRKVLRTPLALVCGSTARADAWIAEAGVPPDTRVEALSAPMALALVRSPIGREICERSADWSPESR